MKKYLKQSLFNIKKISHNNLFKTIQFKFTTPVKSNLELIKILRLETSKLR